MPTKTTAKLQQSSCGSGDLLSVKNDLSKVVRAKLPATLSPTKPLQDPGVLPQQLPGKTSATPACTPLEWSRDLQTESHLPHQSLTDIELGIDFINTIIVLEIHALVIVR